ncbi:hypothetical protein [Botrimarina sp.]|uniref:hypothetical protein n=1 Tax=Botrimarina sp. TaxID=2795802 RepID=UPI0032EC4309
MIRKLLCFTVVLCASPAFGEARLIESDGDGPDIIRMEVTPADEPVPAFKHRLRLWPHELLPGNAPQWYLRAYPEETRAWQAWHEASRDDEFDAFYSSETPVSEAPWDSERYRVAISVATSLVENHVIPGSRRRNSDWGIRWDTMSGPEVYTFLLPEFQSMRALARMANVTARKAIHEGRYDDAINALRACYRLGVDCGAEPIVVCTLIGVAATGEANGGVTDLISAPGSPNLYWALSELPSPPVPTGEAIITEIDNAERIYPFLEDPLSVDRTPAEWNAVWLKWAKYMDDSSLMESVDKDYSETSAAEFLPMAAGLAGYSHAKERLVDWGRSHDEVEAMAVGQVLSLYSSGVYRRVADELKKLVLMPFPEARRRPNIVERAFDGLTPVFGGENREIIPLASVFLPAVEAARTAEVRVARDVAALMVIEALRMHAAQNDGRFPRSLEDIACVPVPQNPATGKPFLYHLDGRTAVLDLPDWEGFPGYSRRYEITIQD